MFSECRLGAIFFFGNEWTDTEDARVVGGSRRWVWNPGCWYSSLPEACSGVTFAMSATQSGGSQLSLMVPLGKKGCSWKVKRWCDSDLFVWWRIACFIISTQSKSSGFRIVTGFGVLIRYLIEFSVHRNGAQLGWYVVGVVSTPARWNVHQLTVLSPAGMGSVASPTPATSWLGAEECEQWKWVLRLWLEEGGFLQAIIVFEVWDFKFLALTQQAALTRVESKTLLRVSSWHSHHCSVVDLLLICMLINCWKIINILMVVTACFKDSHVALFWPLAACSARATIQNFPVFICVQCSKMAGFGPDSIIESIYTLNVKLPLLQQDLGSAASGKAPGASPGFRHCNSTWVAQLQGKPREQTQASGAARLGWLQLSILLEGTPLS